MVHREHLAQAEHQVLMAQVVALERPVQLAQAVQAVLMVVLEQAE
jgi:hypothetical protein